MYIGKVARLAGSTQRAIRLYESLGLIDVPRQGRYRVYDTAHVEFIQLIKEAQGLGLTLKELQGLNRDGNDLDWAQLNAVLIHKREQLLSQIQHLHAQAERIQRYQRLIADCVARDLERCEPPAWKK